MELIRQIVIPQFLVHVKTSESRRPKYDEDGKLLNPLTEGTPKYQKINGQDIYANGINGNFTTSKVIFEMKKQIISILEKEEPIDVFPLIVRGEMYVVDNLHLYSYRLGQLITPLNKKKIKETSSWDIGNIGFIWSKVFDDCLKPYKPPMRGKPTKQNTYFQEWKGLIPDDNIHYIVGTGEMRFIPISDYDERKIIFNIYHAK